MSCKTISATLLPIKKHKIKVYEHEWYNIETEVKPEYNVKSGIDQNFGFLYCVSYRHPSLPEWILARGFWNDAGIWTADWIFPM